MSTCSLAPPTLSRVQVFSQDNKMSAHNLAVVLSPSMFSVMSQDMIALTREFIIHHTLLFLVSTAAALPETHLRIHT